MKKFLVLILSISVSLTAMAQKKELKQAEKLVKTYKFGKAFKALKDLKQTVKGTEYEPYYYFLSGRLYFGKKNKKNFDKAVREFKKVFELEAKLDKKKYSEKVIDYYNVIDDVYAELIRKALLKKDFNGVAWHYESYAKVYPERRDLVTLAYITYDQAKNDKKKAAILEKLIALDRGFKIYAAKNKHLKKVEEFFKKEDRDKAVKNNTHEAPKDIEMDPLTRVGYYNQLVRINDGKGLHKKNVAILRKAKKEFPTNVKFYEDFASVVYKSGDKKLYVKALEDALELDSDNKNLWMNLGVIASQLKQNSKALHAYDEVLRLDPTNRGVYINKALLFMSKESEIITELNQNLDKPKKYDLIKKKLDKMYLSAIPMFEKAYELKASPDIKATLFNLYNTVGMKSKAAAYK